MQLLKKNPCRDNFSHFHLKCNKSNVDKAVALILITVERHYLDINYVNNSMEI